VLIVFVYVCLQAAHQHLLISTCDNSGISHRGNSMYQLVFTLEFENCRLSNTIIYESFIGHRRSGRESDDLATFKLP